MIRYNDECSHEGKISVKPSGENTESPMWIGICDGCGAHTDIFTTVTKTMEKISEGELKKSSTGWLSDVYYLL